MLELHGHSGPVLGLAYSPDGKMLASASADGTARLWDARSGRLMETLSSSEARAYCVAFSQDGKYLAVGYGGERGIAQLWELRPLRRMENWSAQERVVRGVAFRGYRVWTCGDAVRGSPLSSWEVPSIAQDYGAYEENGGLVSSFAFAPDQHYIAILEGLRIMFWEFRKEKMLERRYVSLSRTRGRAGHCLAFSPVERLVACGLEGIVACAMPERHHPPMRHWERSGPPPRYWPAHDGAVLGVSFLPDGQSLLSAATDGLVKHWSLDGQLMNTFDWQIGELGAVAIAPDGLTVAVGGAEKIVVWDLEL